MPWAKASCCRCSNTASSTPKRPQRNLRKDSVGILKRVFDRLPGWRLPWTGSTGQERTGTAHEGGEQHLTLARESLRELIRDSRLPPGIRDSLAHDYAAVQAMLDKLEHG